MSLVFLSGHLGGANELTQEVAEATKRYIRLLQLHRMFKKPFLLIYLESIGWVWESDEKLTPVSASVVNEEHVAVIQESGEKDWWTYDTTLPEHIKIYPTINDAIEAKPNAALSCYTPICIKEEKAF